MRWLLDGESCPAQRCSSTARTPRIRSAAQLVPLSFATERRTVLAVATRPHLLGKCWSRASARFAMHHSPSTYSEAWRYGDNLCAHPFQPNVLCRRPSLPRDSRRRFTIHFLISCVTSSAGLRPHLFHQSRLEGAIDDHHATRYYRIP